MIGPRLQLRQTQRLAMTPQLRQAIKLLQMTNLELERFLEGEMERNPLLAREEAAGAEAPPAPAPEGRLEAALAAPDPGAAAERLDGGAENLWDEAPAAGPAGGFAEGPAPALMRGEGGAEAGFDAAAESPARPTLLEHLGAQIGLSRAPRAVRAAALALAAELDADGRLILDEAEAVLRLGVTPETLAAAIALLQSCEPTGVGARSLAECLALQLAERDRLDPAMQALLDHLPRLAEADFRGLSRLCGVEAEEVREMAAELRRLDPRPGLAFGAPPALAAPPDVLVRPAPGGGWDLELNPETLPRVLIDSAYAARVSAGGDGPTRSFVSECARNAAFLVRSLEQRARTILDVSAEIVRRQEGFLREGVSALRPMTLRMVAEEIGVHESTVSRVVAGKRLACPRGSYELRFFFTQALAAADGGEAVSAAAVRARIRALIEGETPERPLSDDALAARLKAEGVDVARRTVAKYREGMSIPSSARRRRLNLARRAG